MLSIISNIIAFGSTFTVIMTLTIILLQFIMKLLRQDAITKRQENIITILGFMTAVLLIPFYYLPA
jgi:hypothetical protein